MAKSESTKYRLAEAMKTCMKTTSVDDITIRQIVEVCGVTRQTFYRNFLDKYDLINWYFDKLLLKSFEHMGEGTTVYDGLVKKFEYLKEEHLFFAAAFRSDDQNSLKEHDFELILEFYFPKGIRTALVLDCISEVIGETQTLPPSRKPLPLALLTWHESSKIVSSATRSAVAVRC